MKKREIGSGIILIAFIVLICFSGLLWILLEKYVDSTNYENRAPVSRPELTGDNYFTYSKEYEKYFNDNIPFRNNLITMNSTIDYFVFKRSTNAKVTVGKDNWLFYTNVLDGDSLADYQGTKLFSEEELEKIASNCIKQRDFLAASGKEFVIFIAPNKERIYYEKMPVQYGVPADLYRVKQVVEYLKDNTDLRVVYPYDELMDAKENLNSNIYYKTDSHWNLVGGYVGASALLEELGIDMPAIESREITITAGSNTSGDLAGMLNLKRQLKSTDVEYMVEGYDNHNIETVDWDFNNAFIYKAENADLRKIYIIRDSFGSQMSTYIGSQFNNSYLRHRNTYSYDDFLEQNPDILVYETVERYIDKLAEFSVQ